MRRYEHREINSSHDYDVWYVDDRCTKRVDKDKPDYLSWIEAGNTPVVVPYVEPQVDVEEVRMRAIDKATKIREATLADGFRYVREKSIDGEIVTVEDVFDTTSSSRELLSYAVQIAQAKGDDYTREIVLKNGKSVVLSKAEILDLYGRILVYGEGIYDGWLSAYKALLSADIETLKKYIETGKIE